MQEEVKKAIASRNDRTVRPVGSPVMPAGRKSSFAATDVVLPLPVSDAEEDEQEAGADDADLADEMRAIAIAEKLEKQER